LFSSTGDDALIADLLHRLRDHLADGGVAIGRDGADLATSAEEATGLARFSMSLTTASTAMSMPRLRIHRVHAGGNRLGAFAHDRLAPARSRWWCRHRRCRWSWRRLAQHLRAHVLELVLELDLLGDGDAVLGDARGAEALVDHDIAALRAERHLHGIGEDIDAAQHAIAGVSGKFNVFGSHFD
jgi:hypothetical protein